MTNMRTFLGSCVASARTVILAVLALVITPQTSHAVTVEKVVSPGGIEAWLVRDRTIPVIAVKFAFRGGAALDPPDKLGLAEMAISLLDEGAGDVDSETFQRRLNDLAIRLNFDVSLDDVTGAVRTLKENRDAAFELLRLALTSPRFDPDAVERIRNQLLTLLARNAEDPNYIAALAWFRQTFPDHPYGRPTDGTPDTVKSITADDLKAFAKQRLARDNLLIAVVGDITPEELSPLLDKTFGALPEHAAPDTVADVTPAAPSSDLTVIGRQIPQSVAVFGEAGVKRDDPDYYAAYVLNYILGGGGFNSRLTEEVREKRGLAYSVYSYLNPMDHSGLLFGGVATRNEQVKNSIGIIRSEWQRLRDNGVSEDELKNAKSYLTGSFALRLDTSEKIAETVLSMRLERLPIDYLDHRNALIDAVTRDDVNRVAKRLIDPKNLAFVVVGNPEGIAKASAQPLEKLPKEPGFSEKPL